MFKIIQIEKTDSTNNYLKKLAEEKKIIHGNMVIADFQTNGKGQGENMWVSELGMNLTLSLYVKYIQKADKQAWLSKAVALGVSDFIGLYSQITVIKWPNDILVGDRKISGILIEHFVSGQNLNGSIIGIGLNVNQEKFPEELNAISLKEITGAKFKIKDIIKTISACLKSRLLMFELQKWVEIDLDYHRMLKGYQKQCLFKLLNGKEINAVHRGVDEMGRIILETPGIQKNYFDVQEVKMLKVLE